MLNNPELPLFKCLRCGHEFLRKSRNQKYCPACGPIAKVENAKAYRARRKAAQGSVARPVVPGGRKLKHAPPKLSAYVPTTAESLRGTVFDLAGKSLGESYAAPVEIKASHGLPDELSVGTVAYGEVV